MAQAAFIGKGKLRLALFSSGASFESRLFADLENASAFGLTPTGKQQKLPNWTSAAGGTDAAFTQLDSIDGEMDLRHFTPANLALLLWGATNAIAATPITGEAGGKIVPLAFVPTKKPINTSVAPVVKKGATTILAADYTVSAGGITIAATITTGSVVSGDAITIDYTPLAGADVQAFINSAPDVSIHFEGVNQVDGKYSVVKIHKAKLDAVKNLALIGDDFGTLGVAFALQADTTITTVGKSQYFEILQAG